MKTLLATTILAGAAVLGLNAEAAERRTVTFDSHGQTLTGHLYLPDNHKAGDRLPAVVVTGSWTSVKEQMAGSYAGKLADEGYAALAFDFRGWGAAAQNAPVTLRFVEHPAAKTEDIIAAAGFLATRAEVDADRIATLGICASAGYAIDAAHRSPVIQSTAVVAPWLHDSEIVGQVYGEHIPALLASAETPTVLEAAGDDDSDAVMKGIDYYTNPDRGAIDEYDDKFSTLTWEHWLNYDAIETAAEIDSPVLLVHSSAAAIPQGAEKFASIAGSNAKLVMLDDVTQFDFYDNEADMDAAVAEVARHLGRTLR